MKLIQSMVSAACIASLSLGVHGDEIPAAQPAAVVAADIVVLTDSPADQSAMTIMTLPPLDAQAGSGVMALTAPVEPAAVAATEAPVASQAVSNQAAVSALADGMSTIGVLAAGGVELNPVMPTSPVGILMMTAAKMGMARWANGLPDEERKSTLRSMNATFGGAAVNNILVLATAANPIALVGGLIAGVYFWNDTDEKLTAEAEAKAKHYRALAAEHHRVTMLTYNAARVETQPVTAAAIQVQALAAIDAPPAAPNALQLAQAFVAEVEAAEAQPALQPLPPALLPVATQR